MTLKQELEIMRKNYKRHLVHDLKLKKPKWLHSEDPLNALYKEKDTLLQQGQVYYAYIVQANSKLFTFFSLADLPASLVYSTDPIVSEHPEILRNLAIDLFQYKGRSANSIPERYREIVDVITDEYDPSGFNITLVYQGKDVEIHFVSVVIPRRHLPVPMLRSNLLPVLAAEGCKSVLVLPRIYWANAFKKLWIHGSL